MYKRLEKIMAAVRDMAECIKEACITSFNALSKNQLCTIWLGLVAQEDSAGWAGWMIRFIDTPLGGGFLRLSRLSICLVMLISWFKQKKMIL